MWLFSRVLHPTRHLKATHTHTHTHTLTHTHSKGQKQKDLGPPFYLGNLYLQFNSVVCSGGAMRCHGLNSPCKLFQLRHWIWITPRCMVTCKARRGMSRESNPHTPIPPSQLTNALPLHHGGPLLQHCLELLGFTAAYQLRNHVLKIASRGGVLQPPAVSRSVAMVLQSIGLCKAPKGLKITQKSVC